MSADEAVQQMRRDMDRLRGRLFQLCEATNLSDRQVEAFKGLIRQHSYDAQSTLEALLRGHDRP
jgi:hypothetical protein